MIIVSTPVIEGIERTASSIRFVVTKSLVPASGGGGAVDSVNGQTGVVSLDAADVGADATGTAAAAVVTHEADANPHPGYLTQAEGDAAYDALGAAADAQAAAVQRANHTGSQASSTISDFTEAVQDAVAALLGAGSNITLNYDDGANTLTITSVGDGTGLDAEAVRDAIGIALIGSGLISVTVNDALDTITISTTATANDTDANLKARANHTGTQTLSTISDAGTAASKNTGTASGDVPLLSTGGVLPIGRVASGTPDGTKFVRDDGTLAVPAGGGGGSAVGVKIHRANTASAGTLTTSTQPLPSNTFDTTERNDGCTVSLANGTITLPADGWYTVYGHVRYGTGSSSGSNTLIVSDFTTATDVHAIRSTQLSAAASELFVAGVRYFTAGTVLRLLISASSAVTVVGGANGALTVFTVVKVA